MRGGGSAVGSLFSNLSDSVWAAGGYCGPKDSLGEARRREEKRVHEERGSNPKSALCYDVQVPDVPHVPLSICTC